MSALLGCAGALESSWRDPATTADSLRFKQILVVAMARDGSIRRAAEDDLARALEAGPRGQAGELKATPSYQVMDDSQLGDAEKTRVMVNAKGYDGLVLLSVLPSQQRITVDPPMHTPMWGYYGRVGMVYDPGTVRSDTIVRVETNIYSIDDGKLLWSGISRTTNPRDVHSVIEDVVRDVGHALRKEGLLQ
jgi:hypothetical protein